jgi:hypothetical protein
MQTTIAAAIRESQREDEEYETLYLRLRNCLRGQEFAGKPGPTLFTTSAEGLFPAFLAALPAERRQHYRCNSCLRFLERFGGLVTIDEEGKAASPFWDGWAPPPFFTRSVIAMSRIVAKAPVTGVFLTNEKLWGTESHRRSDGMWWHMHTIPSADMVHRPGPLLSSSQVMAEKVQDYAMLCRGLAEYPLEKVRHAYALLTTGTLYRSEKCIGIAKWLRDLHEARYRAFNSRERDNITWRAVATAPAGFCHIRTTMISTLLEDIAVGKPFAEIKRAFDAKMNPLEYQRPQTAPSDGQLAAAEQVIAKLASAGSLQRRFATLEEVIPHAIWTPKKPKVPPPAGVFAHLRTSRNPAEAVLPEQAITWEKFARTLLQQAERIELYVPRSAASYFAFVTASNFEAPPILQWDHEGRRNPVSWYLYPQGSLGTSWGLLLGEWREVTAVTMQSSGWTGQAEHSGEGAYFLLRGARDLTYQRSGLGLFPEILRSEYHGIRAAMEAYSKAGVIENVHNPACGICIQKGAMGGWNQTFRVHSAGVVATYRIDRWD